jgi:hypothetical protein
MSFESFGDFACQKTFPSNSEILESDRMVAFLLDISLASRIANSCIRSLSSSARVYTHALVCMRAGNHCIHTSPLLSAASAC